MPATRTTRTKEKPPKRAAQRTAPNTTPDPNVKEYIVYFQYEREESFRSKTIYAETAKEAAEKFIAALAHITPRGSYTFYVHGAPVKRGRWVNENAIAKAASDNRKENDDE